MSQLALYQLAAQYRGLEQLAESEELPPEVIRDTLDALGGELRDKAVAVAHFLRSMESAADSIDLAADAMSARAERLRERAYALREYLLFHMQATNIPRIDSAYFTLAIRNNPPAVVIDDESAIPESYKYQPPAPAKRVDRLQVAAQLKAGEPVPGCRLEIRQRLEIRV